MHRFYTTVLLAIRNLSLHKLRVLLTILGLIFGVSSVVAMLAIAEGASVEAQRQIASLGATNVIIRSTKPESELNPSKSQNNDSYIFSFGVTYKDYTRIMATIPTVVGATPLREFIKKVRRLDLEIEGRIVGVNPDFLRMSGQQLETGRFLTDADLYQENVTILGYQAAEKLFPYGDPVGKTIRVGEDYYFKVVGVTSYKAPSSGSGSSLAAQDFNKDIYIPLTTDRARFGDVIEDRKQGSFTESAERIELSQITVTVDSMQNVKKTAIALDSLLGQFHPKKDYVITVPLELLEKAAATQRIFNLVLGSIASISLLVGGIGIMNIMLATVSERTREIGIRRGEEWIRARRDIVEQFLIETTVMSASGGLIGVLLGVAVPPLVSYLSGMPVVIRPYSPIVAFLIAVTIGIVFGVYPARRAAMLDPVEALRTE